MSLLLGQMRTRKPRAQIDAPVQILVNVLLEPRNADGSAMSWAQMIRSAAFAKACASARRANPGSFYVGYFQVPEGARAIYLVGYLGEH